MTISIIGFGNFGRLLTRHLVSRAKVVVCSRDAHKSDEITSLGAQAVSLQEAASSDVVILAINLNSFESTLATLVPHFRPGTLVVDVTSVKLKPVEIMKRLVPANCQILATHPLFGPDSAANGLAGHRIVVDPIRVDDMQSIEEFLKNFELEVIHMTADEHDREMAWVHALSFFVGRGLLNINPPESVLTTRYYNELLDLVAVEKTHSLELFNTIQRGNPYADEMRQKFIASLTKLEKQIKS